MLGETLAPLVCTVKSSTALLSGQSPPNYLPSGNQDRSQGHSIGWRGWRSQDTLEGWPIGDRTVQFSRCCAQGVNPAPCAQVSLSAGTNLVALPGGVKWSAVRAWNPTPSGRSGEAMKLIWRTLLRIGRLSSPDNHLFCLLTNSLVTTTLAHHIMVGLRGSQARVYHTLSSSGHPALYRYRRIA